MVKKGHQNGQDQHLKQAPATIYPPQTPYNRKQNQLHGGRHSPVKTVRHPHPASQTLPPFPHFKWQTWQSSKTTVGKEAPRPTLNKERLLQVSSCPYSNTQHQTRKCLRDRLRQPPRSPQTRLSKCPWGHTIYPTLQITLQAARYE